MAVAVTANDRYGSGQSSLLVTRPLVARPHCRASCAKAIASPRVWWSISAWAARSAWKCDATARGIDAATAPRRKTETLSGAAAREVTLRLHGRSQETAHASSSAARAGSDADAVALRVPVQPNYHPLAQTIAGALHDTASAEFTLEQNVDAARSRLEISFGSSTLSILRGARRSLRVYPVLLHRAGLQHGAARSSRCTARKGSWAPGRWQALADEDIRTAIRTIMRRQRPDGGIGYWSPQRLDNALAHRLRHACAAGSARRGLRGRQHSCSTTSAITSHAHCASRTIPRFAVARWYESAPPLTR